MKTKPARIVYVCKGLNIEGKAENVGSEARLIREARHMKARDGWAPVVRGTADQLRALGAVDALGGWFVDVEGARIPCEAAS